MWRTLNRYEVSLLLLLVLVKLGGHNNISQPAKLKQQTAMPPGSGRKSAIQLLVILAGAVILLWAHMAFPSPRQGENDLASVSSDEGTKSLQIGALPCGLREP